jgi:hypothetical protein
MDESQQRTHRRRLGPLDAPQWVELAAQAGHAASQRAELAGKHGLKVSTVGRYVRALRFLEEVGKLGTDWSTIVPALKSVPVLSVELLARWHAYDAQAAFKVARKLVDKELTVTTLREAERHARAGVAVPPLLRSFRHQLRERAARWLNGELRNEFSRKRLVPTSPAVDLLFARTTDESEHVGLLLADQFPDRPLVSKEAEFMTLVLGNAHVLDQMIGLVPEALREECERWIETNLGSLPYNVSLYWISSDNLQDLRPEIFAGPGLLNARRTDWRSPF